MVKVEEGGLWWRDGIGTTTVMVEVMMVLVLNNMSFLF